MLNHLFFALGLVARYICAYTEETLAQRYDSLGSAEYSARKLLGMVNRSVWICYSEPDARIRSLGDYGSAELCLVLEEPKEYFIALRVGYGHGNPVSGRLSFPWETETESESLSLLEFDEQTIDQEEEEERIEASYGHRCDSESAY